MGKASETIDALKQSVGKQTKEVVADERRSGHTALAGVRHIFHSVCTGGVSLLFLVLEGTKCIPVGLSLLRLTLAPLPLPPTATLLSDVFV